MTYINHLNQFLTIARRDKRLSCAHFSMYIALFYVWNGHRFVNPFFIVRDELMAISHIGSKTTYSKVLADLHQFGYIRHDKPKNKHWKSRIIMARFSQNESDVQLKLFENPGQQNQENIASKSLHSVPNVGHLNSTKSGHLASQKWDTMCPENGQLSVPKLGHSINKDIKEVIKREKDSAPSPNNPLQKNVIENSREFIAGGQKLNADATGKHAMDEKQNKQFLAKEIACNIPTLQQVNEFFHGMEDDATQAHPGTKIQEGSKFFAHYSVIGWKLGGTNPIVDWKAAARKWILNCWTLTPKPVAVSKQISKPSNHPPHPLNGNYSAPL